MTLGTTFSYEDLVAGSDLSDDAQILPGTYRYFGGNLRVQMPGGMRFRPTVTAEAGQIFDGRRASVAFSPTWSRSPKINVSAAYGYDRIRFPERDQSFDSHIVRVRTAMTFSTQISFSALVQMNSATDAVIANVRFRYNPREGRDLYLVFNEILNMDRDRLHPILPFTDSRAMIVKYSHTLRR